MAKLIKLAKMAGVTLHRLATDVLFIACVINLPCTFTHYLKLSNFFVLFYDQDCRVLEF